MREYHRKSSGICPTLKKRIKALLCDYDRLVHERANILYGCTYSCDGMPHNPSVGDPTARKAQQLAEIDRELQAIDQTCVEIRGEYSSLTYEEFNPITAYMNYNYFNYMHIRTEKNPEGPSTRTWHRFQDKLAKEIAIKLNLL